jgi:hypothetical protein
VQSKSADGKVTTYRSTELTISEDSLQRLLQRRMDCIDCHNRPTHIYHPPARSINHVMSLGWIDPRLPGVKGIALQALEAPYVSKQAGVDSIRLRVEEFYRTRYPDVAARDTAAISRAVLELQKIYSRNYFPEMGVSWKRFNDNVGHMYSPGCFRCHDGKHVSREGKVLSRDCSTCHVILAQQFEQDTMRISLGGIQYQHPVDIGDAWKETNCSDCHNAQ